MLRNRAFILFSLLLACAPVAAQAHKSHARHTSAPYHSTASGALVNQLRQYYAYQDSGWQALDASRVVSRMTADYVMTDQTGAVTDLGHYADEATAIMRMVIDKNATIQFHTNIEHVNVSGDKAIVIRRRRIHLNLARQVDDTSVTATGNATGFRNKDTWIHLPSGWYLAQSENLTLGFDINMVGKAE